MNKAKLQKSIEIQCSKATVRGKLRKQIVDGLPDLIKIGVEYIHQYVAHDYWENKNLRIAEWVNSDDYNPTEAVVDILCSVMPVNVPQQIQNVAAAVASRLGYDDKIDGIKTAAELIGVIAHTGAYEFIAPVNSETGSLLVRSCYDPSAEMLELAQSSIFLPPMLVPPNKITCNSDSGYLTGKSSIILGAGNHHDYKLPLDVINRDNAIPLCIDKRMMAFTEEPKKAFTEGEKYEECPNHLKPLYVERKRLAFENLVSVSDSVYKLILDNDNLFYLTHNVDERIRYYDKSYFIGHQSSEYKKSLVDLYDKEIITC